MKAIEPLPKEIRVDYVARGGYESTATIDRKTGEGYDNFLDIWVELKFDEDSRIWLEIA